MYSLKTSFSPMLLLNLVIADMRHARSHKHHKSREIHIFEKVQNATAHQKNAHLKVLSASPRMHCTRGTKCTVKCAFCGNEDLVTFVFLARVDMREFAQCILHTYTVYRMFIQCIVYTSQDISVIICTACSAYLGPACTVFCMVYTVY